MKTIPTSEKVAVENYPYGFTLKTTLFDSIEFKKGKGYRHVTQTINPKNGKLNKPKASTYVPLMVRFYDENGHIKTNSFDFNGAKEMNRAAKFVNENFDLFTADEIKYIYSQMLSSAKLQVYSMVQWAGADLESVKPLVQMCIDNCLHGIEHGTNNFEYLILDIEAIDNCKDPNYNPWSVKETAIG